MTSLQIKEEDIPSLTGKVALVTGGSSGIGLAAVQILTAKGAKAFILDLRPPTPEDGGTPPGATFLECDTARWPDLKAAFKQAGRVDVAVANAGVSEEQDYFADRFDDAGELLEPKYNVLEVNYRGVLNVVKLATSYMRREGRGGSIVITSSATAYAPEQSLPVYSATKLALVGLVRALRSTLPLDNITINSVAPASTITRLLPQNLAVPLMAAGLPVSSAYFVGLAVVYSAVAKQDRQVEAYGKDKGVDSPGRWNGRTILTLGDGYTELEEPIASLRPQWFGKQNTELTRAQQIATDLRSLASVDKEEDVKYQHQ